MSYLLLENYIKEIMYENKSNAKNNTLTWGEFKQIINASRNEKVLRKLITFLLKNSVKTFVGIKLAALFPAAAITAAAVSEISTDALFKFAENLNKKSKGEIFIQLAKKTNAFQEITKDDEKAIKALNDEAIKEVFNSIESEMKSVSLNRDLDLSKIPFHKFFNGFLQHAINLKISYK